MLKFICPVCQTKSILKESNTYQGKSLKFKCPQSTCNYYHTFTYNTVVDQEEKNFVKNGSLLLIKNKFHDEIKYLLGEGITMVGRKTDICRADISINSQDTMISRMHFRITGVQNSEYLKFLISDNGSKNKVYLNNKLLNKDKYLKDGDIISVGESKLIFNYKDLQE